jgi:hypothetical protein
MDAGEGVDDGNGAVRVAAVEEPPADMTPPPPAPAPPAGPSSASGPGAGTPGSGEKPVKRMMKTPYQLEVLESTYAG